MKYERSAFHPTSLGYLKFVSVCTSWDPRHGLENFAWPKVQNTETSVETVLDDHPADARKLSKQVVDCLEVWDDFLHLSPKTVELPSFRFGVWS